MLKQLGHVHQCRTKERLSSCTGDCVLYQVVAVAEKVTADDVLCVRQLHLTPT